MLQLADRSIRYPKGIIEDILVQVKDLVFPADFYVLDMSNELVNESTLILGRPFLQTSKTIISMKHSCITMEVGEHVVTFNMNEATRYPFDNAAFVGLNAIDLAVEQVRDEHEMNMHDVYHMNPTHLLDSPSELASEIASHDSSLSAYDAYFESLSSVYSFSNSCGNDVSCVNSLEIDSMLSISQDFSFPSNFDSLSKFISDITAGKEPLVLSLIHI